MTWEQYWYGDVWMVEGFREADKLNRRRTNAAAHMMGMYIYEAFCDVAPVLHAFAKKGTKPIPYRTEPYPMRGEEKTKLESSQEIENERLKAQLSSEIGLDLPKRNSDSSPVCTLKTLY